MIRTEGHCDGETSKGLSHRIYLSFMWYGWVPLRIIRDESLIVLDNCQMLSVELYVFKRYCKKVPPLKVNGATLLQMLQR